LTKEKKPAEIAKKPARLTQNSKLFKVILEAIFDKKGQKIVSLDLRKVNEAVADYFIICEADNSTQIKAIGFGIQDDVKAELGEAPFKHEGFSQAKWILIDYVNIVIHIMHPESRKYYNLEDMWHDAVLTEHTEIIKEIKQPKPKVVKAAKTKTKK
jgi:ribosome-associated protein